MTTGQVPAPDWRPHAARLAGRLAHPASRWHGPVAGIPRHLLVPRWFERSGGTWELREGTADPGAWMQAAYHATGSLVTQVGSLHADHAAPGDAPAGLPASSSTNPYLVMQMYRHARIHSGCDVLDVGTGSGYGCAILARRLGGANVTSIDIDPYLTRAAAGRLASQGICPRIITADAAAGLDWAGDRIIAMVAVPAIPPSWLAALRTGGRLVTTIAGTSIIITASKTPDGGAWGKIEWDRAGFMNVRSPAHGPPPACPAGISDGLGEAATGRYPVIDVENARELRSLLELALPGITHTYQEDPDGCRTASMTCPDGSWATAAGYRGEPAQVRHGGPRNPWEALDRIRDDWLADGCLPLYGAEVRIDPDGTSHLTRGTWHATIPPAAPLQSSTRPPP